MRDDEALSNRQKAMRPKTGKHYCNCDLTHVGAYQKCDVCGKRRGRYRLKKQTNA